MKEDALRQTRDQINQIDDDILALLKKRATLAVTAMQHKCKEAIFSPSREHHILQRMVANNTSLLSGAAVKSIYGQITKECRFLQQRISSIGHQEFKISVQGIAGCFTAQAAQQYCHNKGIQNPSLHYATTSANVIDDVMQQRASIGIMAINNDQGGLVGESIDALLGKHYTIVDTVVIVVRQMLLAKNALTLDQITDVYSHDQAIKQCQDFVNTQLSHCRIHAIDDTALAAQNLKNGLYNSTTAVIASKNAAELYELKTLKQDIQTLDNNTTLFLVVAKRGL